MNEQNSQIETRRNDNLCELFSILRYLSKYFGVNLKKGLFLSLLGVQ